jgi:hypothetical protein
MRVVSEIIKNSVLGCPEPMARLIAKYPPRLDPAGGAHGSGHWPLPLAHDGDRSRSVIDYQRNRL